MRGRALRFRPRTWLDSGRTDNCTAAFTIWCRFRSATTAQQGAANLVGNGQYFASGHGSFPAFLRQNARKIMLNLDRGNDFSGDFHLETPAVIEPAHWYDVLAGYRYNTHGWIALRRVGEEQWRVWHQAYPHTISAPGYNWLVGTSHENAGGGGQTSWDGDMAFCAMWGQRDFLDVTGGTPAERALMARPDPPTRDELRRMASSMVFGFTFEEGAGSTTWDAVNNNAKTISGGGPYSWVDAAPEVTGRPGLLVPARMGPR